MRLFRRTLRVAHAFDTTRLWDVSRRLTGWTLTGTDSCDVPTLIAEAADEIRRLQELTADDDRPALLGLEQAVAEILDNGLPDTDSDRRHARDVLRSHLAAIAIARKGHDG